MNEELAYDNSGGSTRIGSNFREAEKAGDMPAAGQDNRYLRLFVFALFFFSEALRASTTSSSRSSRRCSRCPMQKY